MTESKKSHGFKKAPLLERVSVSHIMGRNTSPQIILGISSREFASYGRLLPPHISEYYRESRGLTTRVERRRLLTEEAATHVGGIENLKDILSIIGNFNHYLTEEQTLRLEKVTRLRGKKIVR